MLLYKISDGYSVGVYPNLAAYPDLDKIVVSPQNYSIRELHINSEGKVVATRTIPTERYVTAVKWANDHINNRDNILMTLCNSSGRELLNYNEMYCFADVLGQMARFVCLQRYEYSDPDGGYYCPTLKIGPDVEEQILPVAGYVSGKSVPLAQMTWEKLKAVEQVSFGSVDDGIKKLDEMLPGWRRLKSDGGLTFAEFIDTWCDDFPIDWYFVPELIEVDGGCVVFDEKGEMSFHADVQSKNKE
jgi:hypothetical protein